MVGRHLKGCMQEAYTRVSAIQERRCWRDRYLEECGWCKKQQCRVLREDGRRVVRRCIQTVQGQETEQQDRWDKESISKLIGATQVDPLPPPPVPFEGARVQREGITRTDIEAFGTSAGCPGCSAIRSGKRAQAHSDPCRVRIEEYLKTTPAVSERSDRRSKVWNEHSQKMLREASEEERKEEVQQESWQYQRS